MWAVAAQPYPITRYQPVYYVADSLSDAKERMLSFCDTSMSRSFRVRYDPFTQSVTTDRAIARGSYDTARIK